MREFRSGVVTFMLCLAACRTGGTPSAAQAPTAEIAAVAPAAPAPAPAPEPQAQAQALPREGTVPRDSQPVTLISGFSLNGHEECVPLKHEAELACIKRTEPLQAVCAQRQGALLRCDDCRVLCSRSALKKSPRAGKPSP